MKSVALNNMRFWCSPGDLAVSAGVIWAQAAIPVSTQLPSTKNRDLSRRFQRRSLAFAASGVQGPVPDFVLEM